MTREEYYNQIFNKTPAVCSNENLYRVFFEQAVLKLKDHKGLNVLFGNQDGSRSRGLSNRSSDIDMHVFGKTDNPKIAYELMWEEGEDGGQTIVYDIAPHCAEFTLQEVEAYGSVARRYPTVFYRTQEEENKYLPENIHWNIRYREDGEIFEFIQFLIADTIFLNESAQINMERFYQLVKTVDMLDLQYVRAYGNFQHYIKGKEEVLVRKYLYTCYELFFCEWMIQKGTRPPMVFQELMEGVTLKNDVMQSIYRLLKQNEQNGGHKTKLTCAADKKLNQYLAQMLQQLRQKIADYDIQEKYFRVIQRTEPERRQKILWFHTEEAEESECKDAGKELSDACR